MSLLFLCGAASHWCQWPSLAVCLCLQPSQLPKDPPGHGWALWVVCRCLGDSSCLLGSDLQSSHCTLDEACEDLDWDTEKGLEAMACETEGFLPPKVMVRPTPGCTLMALSRDQPCPLILPTMPTLNPWLGEGTSRLHLSCEGP